MGLEATTRPRITKSSKKAAASLAAEMEPKI